MKLAVFVLALALSAWTVVPPALAQTGPASLAYEGTESIASVLATLDVTCILRTWRITGVFVCTHGFDVTVCVITENAYPVGILEAVRRPFTSYLAEVNSFTEGLGTPGLFGESSSHTPDSRSGTGLHFTEAHAYQFVPQVDGIGGLPISVPNGQFFTISYLSELDGTSWRTGFADLLFDPGTAIKKAGLPACSVVPRPGDCAWRWGSWFPRTGFASLPSEVIAGHLLALRGGKVAARPFGRVVLGPYTEPRTGHYVQMIRPVRKTCFSIGWPLTRLLEAGALSRAGAYLFVQFSIFRQCDGCFPALLVEPRPPSP